MYLSKLKKIFNIQSKEQKYLISKQILEIEKIIINEQNKLDIIEDEKRKKFETEQNTCSICSSKKVVNKLHSSIKTSSSQPRFIFQTPSRYSYSIDRFINKCSECGNEWEKSSWYDTFYFKNSRSHIEILTNLFKIYSNDNKKYYNLLKQESKIYDKYFAESIYIAFKKIIPLFLLRKIFKSIFLCGHFQTIGMISSLNSTKSS